MASKLTCKTYPIDCGRVTGFDLNPEKNVISGNFENQPGNLEMIFERQNIANVENALKCRRTTFGNIGEHALDNNNFPSIEGTCALAVAEISENHIKLPSDLHLDRHSISEIAAKEWKREKTFDGSPIFSLGEKGSGLRPRGTVQHYSSLRSACLEKNQLFEDNEFPAVDSSLQFTGSPGGRKVEWLRPKEIIDNPSFFFGGFSRFDVRQGELGDCWLLAAVATLTQSTSIFHRVVPDGQEFDKDYCGLFHFRFWQYGRWIDVVIDDRLPTFRGELLYMHSTEKNEFWSALLEKAYAKLHGSYEALKGGTACEAMEDFTGGVTELYELKEAPSNLFSILMKAIERDSMLGCSIEADPNALEAITPEGLVKGHAYSITKVKLVDIKTPNTSGKLPMICLRNPWGNEAEWRGPWSDQSAEWRFIPDETKADIGLKFDLDGEFWMSFQDWLKHFDRVEICNLTPDSLTEEEITAGKKKWEMSVIEGEWTKGITAGGCRNFLDTFWRNPQYVISVVDQDDDDDDEKCTLIVALMQKHRRLNRNMGTDMLSIGFAIYNLSEKDLAQKPLTLDFFKFNASVARSPSYINLREISCRFKLPPGNYLIVPSTFEANQEAEFLIRVFSEQKNVMEENDDTVGEVVDETGIDAPDPSVELQTLLPGVDVEKLFSEICGDDNEIDAYELKQILDKLLLTIDEPTKDSFKKKAGFFNIFSVFCKGPVTRDEMVPMVPLVSPKNFSVDACRSMVAMLDTDKSGKMGLLELKNLLHSICKWNLVFEKYDVDQSDHLSAFELREALNSAGFKLNNRILTALCHRYSSRDNSISFCDFIACAVKIKTMLDIFKERDVDGTNVGSFTLEEWIALTIY